MSDFTKDVFAAVETSILRVRNLLATRSRDSAATNSARQSLRKRFDITVSDLVTNEHRDGVAQVERYANHYERLVPDLEAADGNAWMAERIRLVCETIAAGMVVCFERQLGWLALARNANAPDQSSEATEALNGLLRANDIALGAMENAAIRLEQTMPQNAEAHDTIDILIADFEREVAEAHAFGAKVPSAPQENLSGDGQC